MIRQRDDLQRTVTELRVELERGQQMVGGTSTFCKDGVDTPHNGVDTTPQTQRQKAEEMLRLSTQDEGRSTLDLVPRTACFQNWDSRSTLPPEQIWDSVSTPPPGQVDTLRKDSNLRWMIATCHPRAMKQLKRLKEADQVGASVGEDFKEDPKFKSAEHRLALQESKPLPNLSFYKGLASQKATQEFKDLSKKLEMEKQDKQQKIEEIKTLQNQLKERDEVIQTFTKGKDNLEALLGTNMTTTSHGLGFNKQKPKKDKSGEKKGKAPLIKFVKGHNLENTKIKQTSDKTSNKTQNKSKTQKQKKTTRSTQSPDRSTPVHKKKASAVAVSTLVMERSTCSTSTAINNSIKNSNKNLENKKKSKEIIYKEHWTSKTAFQDDWTNPWSQWSTPHLSRVDTHPRSGRHYSLPVSTLHPLLDLF
ncbi:hypothetical protein Taro_001897 [Colocasia esculenta]|uniref:Uncharacterized protein n=1 Tax=Colocasia esculenta TaxID=4460 RepID=A0A843TJE2_COLES|nr:hypothetical protein [Colocasia esculenta]